MATFGTCTHERTYFDLDEVRCRSCGVSITYPPHHPTLEEKGDRARAAHAEASLTRLVLRPRKVDVEVNRGEVSCMGCHLQQLPGTPAASGKVSCEGCKATVLLRCNCCKELLPDLSFYRDATQTRRECLTARCRRCFSAHKRAQRLHDPEAHRALGEPTST